MGVLREAAVIANINVKVTGLDAVIRKLSDQVVRQQFEDETEKAARTMANDAAKNAPRDTGQLANSLVASVRKEGAMKWSFGSELPYARRQEYEHSTNKAYVRRAVWDNEEPFKKAMERVAGRIGK